MRNLVFNFFLALFLASGIGMAIEVAPMYPFLGIVALQLIRALVGASLPTNILADAVDVSALTAYAGKNKKGLLATMINGLDFLKDVMIVPNVKNKLRIGKLDVGAGTRPFSSEEEFEDGGLNYTDRFLEVSAGKREIKIDPEKYRTTYLSEDLTAGSGANKMEIPYAQFTWAQVFKALWAEVNNDIAWAGFDLADAVAYSEVATYSTGDYVTYIPSGTTVKHWYKALANTLAGEDPDDTPAKWKKVTASAVFKGYGTRIIEEVTDLNIAEEAIGAIDATSGVAKGGFLELYRSMPEVYQHHGVIINCSYTDWNFLQDDIENVSKYTRHDATVGPGQTPKYMYLPNSNNQCIVKPATWIKGRRLIAGPAVHSGGEWRNSALLFGTDLLSDLNDIKLMITELWKLKAGIKYLGGTQIANLDEIRINDQE